MKYKIYLPLLFTLPFFCVNLHAQCSFTSSNPSPCATELVDFTVDNPGTSTWTWDFENDGLIDDTGTFVNYSFPQLFYDSTYQVVLYENADSCTTMDQLVLAVPDPSIGVTPGITTLVGTEIKACNGDELLTLEIYNASVTFESNLLYEINWGDNSPTESFDNTTFSQTNTISHTYSESGYFNIFITVTHQNGCVFTQLYTLYNGGNPSVGLVIPGNTVGLCAPATLEFPITNAEDNPPGTVYSIYINGLLIESFDQDSLPPSFVYTFEENSCGLTTSTGNYENAYDVQIVASNPCNSSTATIEPIEVSEPPSLSFEIIPESNCAGSEIEFDNTSVNIEVVSGNPSQCIDVLAPSWDILGGVPGTDWEIISGNIFNSDSLIILFNTPGVYVIEMTVVSFACGPFTLSQEVTILDPPLIEASLSLDTLGNSGCAPVSVPIVNNSSGQDVTYSWSITPNTGWYFSTGSDSTSTEPEIIFEDGGTYDIVLMASNPCETLSWDTTIVVFGPPLIDPAPLPDACLDATISFDASTVSYDENGDPITTYLWGFPGSDTPSSSDPFPTDIYYDQPGSYPISVMVSNGCGDSFWVDTFDIEIPEVLTMPDPTALCNNEAIIQLIADPPGGTWAGTGINPDGTFDPMAVSDGNYTVNYTFGVGACFVEGQTDVQVFLQPDVQLPAPMTLCANDSPINIAPNPLGGIWTDPNGILAGDMLDPQQVGPGSYLLEYEFTDSNNCSDNDSLQVVINDYPQPIASDSSFCNTPGAVSLPIANPIGGTWSGIGVVNPNGLFDPAQTNGPGNYTLTYSLTDSTNCTGETDVLIVIIDPENVEAGNNTTICQEDTPIILADLANPPGGNWSSTSPGFTGQTFDPTLANPGSHWLYYSVGTGNCAVMDSIRIKIVDLTLTSAGPNQSVCIDGGLLELNGYDPVGGTWSGDGITDPVNGFFDPTQVGIGQHEIYYYYEDPVSGCSIEIPKMISVKPKPEPNFETPTLGCIDEPIQFFNQTPDGLYYQWNFGDGETSIADDPIHIYDATGIYTVNLLATNNFGCERDTSLEIQIAAPPEAGFLPDNFEGCAGAIVNFTNSSIGESLEFLWDFGNGEFSNDETPTGAITYAQGLNDTTYQVNLEVINACGTDSWTETITVYPLPISDFGFTVDTGCSPLLLEINNISLGSPNSFYWDLGNGNFSTDSLPPIQTYTTDTTTTIYTITLITENTCGNDTLSQEVVVNPETVTAFFNVDNTEGCAPFTVEFTDYTGIGTIVSWNFGDGNSSDEVDPVYTFNESGIYTITQYASNTCGADSTTMDIEVYASPVLSFEWEDPLCENIPIQFQNTSPDLAASYWTFDTGDFSDETNPLYQFPGPGVYEITLEGTGLFNACASAITLPIEIQEAPIASADATITNGCAPLAVNFTDQSTGADFYFWEFGDNNSSIEAEPSHLFLDAGDYEVVLTVSNMLGCSDEVIISPIQVWPNPVAEFATMQDTFCGLPANVNFENLSIGADGFTWDFGNNIQSNLNNPVNTYDAPGNYPVQLNVFNQYGCTDVISYPIQIFPVPLADFAFQDTTYCSPQEVAFENYSVGDNFNWDFGDGQYSQSDNPIHTYEEGGSYEVTLISSFGTVCSDTLILPNPLEVLTSPIAGFEYLDGQNGILEFINTTINGDYYFWDFGDGYNSEDINPTHRFSQNGLRQIFLLALNENGCRDSVDIQIQPELFGSLFVPNALTPEQGDEEVRVFLPKGVGITDYRLQIFSPYGQLIWETTELLDGQPAIGWDGTLNGELLPMDVYVWKVFALFEDGNEWKGLLQPNGTYKRIGSVTLIR